MTAIWAKMPSSWIIQDRGLANFSIRDVGSNAQALKNYMTIALMANFNPNKDFPEAGCAAISYSMFEEIAGGSRTLIGRGLRVLEGAGLIETDTSTKTHVYQLQRYADPGFAQLPKLHILRGKPGSRIADLPLRLTTTLNGLRLYLLLAAFRDTTTNKTLISYDKIEEYAKIRRKHIHPAIQTLIEYGLISRRGSDQRSDVFESEGALSNEYTILGLQPRNSRRSPDAPHRDTEQRAELENEL